MKDSGVQMRTRRAYAGLIGILALLACESAAPGGWVEDRDGRTIVHIVIQKMPDPYDNSTNVRADRAAIGVFKKRFGEIFARRYRDKYKADPVKYGRHNWDNVEIELHRFTGIDVGSSEIDKDLLAIAGGKAPDVLYVNFRRSDNYIRNRFLYPLDKPEDGYMSSMSNEDIDFRIHPKIKPVIRRKGPDGRTHVWAMPYGGALGKVLLFRKDLFDEKGIPYPTIDWTWDDMIAAARKLTDPKKGTYGLQLGRGKHESWHWITYLWSAGGEVMVYNKQTDQWRCVFDTRAAAVALDFYIRLSAEKWTDKDDKIRRGYSSKDAEDSADKWRKGLIGMRMSYVDEKLFSTINPEVTGMVPVPLGPTGIRGGELNSRMLGLFAGIKHPAVRDASWEYVRFYDCSEAVRIKTRIMVEGGLGRFINPKYLRMFGYPEIERLSPKGWARTFEIAIETGKPEPYGRNSNFAYDMMTIPIQQAEQLARDGELPKDRHKRLDVLQELLRKGCAVANERMIGIVTPEQRRLRDITAVAVLIAIAITFALVFRRIIRTFTPPKIEGLKQPRWGFRRYFWAYVLLAPAVLTILIWRYFPLVRGSVMAFQDYRLIGESSWVGIQNFGDILFDNFWWQSVWNAIRYSLLVISLTFIPPIILAILLQEVPHGKLLFRTIYYLPAVITGLVTILLWKQFYDASDSGMLNAIIMKIPAIAFLALGVALFVIALLFAIRVWRHDMHLASCLFILVGVLLLITCAGMAGPILRPIGETLSSSLARAPSRLLATTPEPYNWLSDSKTAMIACVIPMVWAGIGPGCLIYLAALKGIPEDFYEAADIDGATFIDKILFVIFPYLKPLIIINFIGVFIGSWYRATGSILAMTGGAADTEIAGLHIWYKAFTYLQFGPATAMAWMLGFMLIGFTVYQLRILARVEFRTTGDKK